MKRAIAGCLVAIAVLLFTTALGLAVIHVSDFPYVLDVDLLNICEKAELPRAEVILNYNVVMEYLSPFTSNEFALPTLGYTAQSSFHFYECKNLFKGIYIMGLVSALILAFLYKKKAVSKLTLRVSGIVTLAIPVVIGAALLTNFDWVFAFFHSMFFAGETWIFDPNVDEIIKIMPSEFFMHCAIFIALFWIAGAAIQLKIGYLDEEACKT